MVGLATTQYVSPRHTTNYTVDYWHFQVLVAREAMAASLRMETGSSVDTHLHPVFDFSGQHKESPT